MKMQQSLRIIGIVAILVFVALAAFALWWRSQGNGGNDPDIAQGASTGYIATGSLGDATPEREGDPAFAPAETNSITTSYDEQFRTTNDLAPFAEVMHKRALEGDDAAQYWLYRALQRCGPTYDAVFGMDPAVPDKTALRLDEALADEEANPRRGADEIREMHQQCQQLRAIDRARFGDAANWLKRAAQTGYPLAQMGRAANIAAGLDGAANRAEARALMLAALKSGDAEVILHTGAVARMVAQGESERERHEWVWEVAACQRGANCGPTTEWVRSLCAVDKKCQPHETAIDVIRRRVGVQLPEIEEEARTLNARIDAREWGELGL